MLNVKELEAFRAFIESGSVTAAAERLHRTQPQIGRLLTSLEETVGFRLFDRVGRRLQPTAEGWRFYDDVERVMRDLQSLSRSAAHIRTGVSDHLRILVAPHVVGALVAGALAEVQARNPKLTAEVRARTRRDIETWIVKEKFDVGISVLPAESPFIEVEPFLRNQAVIIMHHAHPLASREAIDLDALLGQPLILTHPRSLLRQSVERLYRERRQTPVVQFETTNGLTACELAAHGLGIAFADPFVALSVDTRNLCIRQFVPELPLEYGFIFPAGRSRPKSTREFTDAVRVTAAKRLAELGLTSSQPISG